MKRLVAKLGFVHRTLWDREQTYRWAFLLGPPPLLGGGMAALAWAVVQHMNLHARSPAQGSDAPWAHWTRPVAEESQPFSEAPTAALPRSDANGQFVGIKPGWSGAILPISVDATLDIKVMTTVAGNFTLDQPTIPVARILDAGPPTGLFIGAGRTLFVARAGGLYAFSARLTRDGTQSATCMVRLASHKHRILRNVILNAAGDAVLNFPATEFRLEPGLFLLQAAVGCWRGDHMAGGGELTLMVRHPGESVLAPAMANEVIRSFERSASGPDAAVAQPTHSPSREHAERWNIQGEAAGR